jgi:HEAT repeat protein
LAKGNKWEDVVCRSLKIEVLQKDRKKEVESLQRKDLSDHVRSPVSLSSIYSTSKLIGNYRPGNLKNAPYYIKQIESGNEIGQALLALGALRDPRAKEVLERVIAQDKTHPFQNRVWACQAFFQSVGRLAAPMMLRILERDKSITWHDPQNKWSQDAMWLHTAGMAAAILASIQTFDGRERAADIIAETLTGKRTATDPRSIWRGEEICWGLIKSLGKLGSKKHVPLLKTYLKKDSDARTMAIQALGDIGDPSVVPDLLSILRNFKYSPNGLCSIEVLGKIGKKEIGPALYPLLSHWDEDFRVAAVIALGKIGDTNAIVHLKGMMKTERIRWVTEACRESLRLLQR